MERESKPLVVTVRDDALADIQDVADRLAAEGMQVERVMPVMGVITGRSPPATLPALARVRGVMRVEEEAIAQLPPPDSPVQ